MCFAIQSSYQRREKGLHTLANFKASLISVQWRIKHALSLQKKSKEKFIRFNIDLSEKIATLCVDLGR